MKQSLMKQSLRHTAAVLFAAITALSLLPTTALADPLTPSAGVQCPTGVPIWSTSADNGAPTGLLWLRDHIDPEGAGTPVTAEPVQLGSGWFGRTLAGPNAVMWDVHTNQGPQDPHPNGALLLWRWNGASWEGGTAVGWGWQRYTTPEFRNLVTIDSQGRIYAVNERGELRMFHWNGQSWDNPLGVVLDTEWEKYNLITAAGDGVIYARTHDGRLFRSHFNHTSNQWEQRESFAGQGWNQFSQLFSPGADILYARGGWKNNQPVLRWYRYNPATNTWAPADPDGAGTVIASGFNTSIDITADPSACTTQPPN